MELSNNWKNYYFFQKECRQEIRKAEQDHINNTINEGLQNNNTKPFWQYVKSRREDSIGVAPLKKDGTLISNSKEKAQLLVKQFQSVFTKSDVSDGSPNLSTPEIADISEIKVDRQGIIKLLKNLNPRKACGPDSIPNMFLKNYAEELSLPLQNIFQSSLNSGDLPDDWKKANISCAFKKGDKHLPENYRPISLTSVCCKLLEHIVSHHIHDHFKRYNVLTDRNHGFRSGHSCETQLATTLHDLLRSYDKGNQVDICVLDFSKAFDTVPHHKLLHKLSHYGVKGNTLKWIKHFLTDRKMKVVLDGESSEEVAVESGVPQGTVLGPLLFLVHINDLPGIVSSEVRLFADDCLLYREIRKGEDHDILQEDLDRLEKWAKDWGMRFNTGKCNILSVKKKSNYQYSLNSDTLKEVDNTPYLGVLISNDLKWKPQIFKQTNKANSILGFLKRNLRNCPSYCRKSAYISLVRSVVEYGAIVWDPYEQGDIDRLERVQNRGIRFISKDYTTRKPGTITALRKQLDLPTLEQRRRDLRHNLFRRVVEGSVPGLPLTNFLEPQKENKRQIKPKIFSDFVTTNIVERSASTHNQCFQVPPTRTNQYGNSFFIRTTIEWNNSGQAHK